MDVPLADELIYEVLVKQHSVEDDNHRPKPLDRIYRISQDEQDKACQSWKILLILSYNYDRSYLRIAAWGLMVRRCQR